MNKFLYPDLALEKRAEILKDNCAAIETIVSVTDTVIDEQLAAIAKLYPELTIIEE